MNRVLRRRLSQFRPTWNGTRVRGFRAINRGRVNISPKSISRFFTTETWPSRFSIAMTDGALDFWSNSPSPTAVPVEPDAVYGRSENLMVKKNIGYIVCGVILRGSKSDAELLMIQEVDGDWYLPAGRLEAGETIEDGMKREVKEEAGVDCESLGLIAVETVRPAWYRFVYLARHTGGSLKATAESDKESIQGAWIRVDHVLNGSLPSNMRLRSRDILWLIRLAMQRQFVDTGLHPGRTIQRPLVGLFARFVLTSGNKILLRRRHFPLVEYSSSHHLADIAVKFLGSVTDSKACNSDDFKVISVEALPIPAYHHDGSCFTVLIDMSSPTVKQHAEEDGYQWIDIASDPKLSESIQYWRQNFAILHL